VFEWVVPHLDKREIVISSRPGEVIKPESLGGQPFVKVVSGEGMPSRGNPFMKGDLYVLFTIEFPKDDELSEDTVNILKKTLPNPKRDLSYGQQNLNVANRKHFNKSNFAIIEI
jgi:DnaJ family protein A protein 2